MKRIHLLRHAKSSWGDPSLSDIDRPLNQRGRDSAFLMADYFRTAVIAPAVTLCSTALRARQTLEALVRQAAVGETLFEDGLYAADARRLLARLRTLPDDGASVLLVGHNPGIEQLAVALLAPLERGGAVARLRDKYPTGTLATLEAPIARWTDLAPGLCHLTAFVRPADLVSTPV